MKRLILLFALFCLVSGCFWRNAPKKTYVIYRSNVIEGVNLQGKETSIQGFIDDLFFEIAKRKGFLIEFQMVINGKTLSMVRAKEADAVIGTIDITPQNQKLFLYSQPLYAFGPVMVIRANDPYKSLAELKDKFVAFDRNYAGYLEGKSAIPFIFKPYDQMTFAMEDLVQGKIDAVVCDSFVAYQYVNSFYANKIKVATGLLKEKHLRLITYKKSKNHELIEIFDEGLQELKAQGTYKKMLNYWGIVDPTSPQK